MEAAPHIILVPVIGHSHTIPMFELGCILAERGARVSLVATPVHAATALHGPAADRARRGLLPIEIMELPYPPADDRLPRCKEEIVLVLRDRYRLAGPLVSYLRTLPRRPSCIIHDMLNPWAVGVARTVGVPRLVYSFSSCFYSLCDLKGEDDDDGYAVVPGSSMRVRVEMNLPGWDVFREEAREGLRTADGVVLNTFLELEQQFVARYGAALQGKPVWALGPFFLSNTDRGRQAESSKCAAEEITAWLDAKGDQHQEVIYVSFGSLVRMPPKQLYEVGHGLEDSGKPFLWVVNNIMEESESESWLRALEARTAGRGLVVRGWARQVTILTHPAVRGFLTHCGWNSLLESVACGVPVATWPHYTDQFMNSRLAVDVLGIGVRVAAAAAAGAGAPARGDVARAVSELMGAGELAQERRRKARYYGEKAHRAMEEGGSSCENLTNLMQRLTKPQSNPSSCL